MASSEKASEKTLERRTRRDSASYSARAYLVENARITFLGVTTLETGADSVEVMTMLTRLAGSPTETR